MKVHEAAVQILRETNNPAVMFGDSGLLHMICERAGRPHEGWKTEKKILDALSRSPGILIPGKTCLGMTDREVRIFRLPPAEPAK